MNKKDATSRYLISVTIYGTIGFFLHYVNASSEFVVLCRGIIGSFFIFVIMFITKNMPNIKDIKNNLVPIFFSGIALGINWVFLFSGYRYGIAMTSLCNYIAPIIVVIISSIFLKEKLSLKQIICIIGAFLGIILISGIFDLEKNTDYHCIIYGLLAAIGFVVLVLCNKRIKNIKPLDKTLAQLFVSVLVVLPYVLFNNRIPVSLDIKSWLIILVLGIAHTGFAYYLYFNSIDTLPTNKVAILGYIEPVLSILIGALVFKEKMSMFGVIGTILVLMSALFSEIKLKNNK